MSGFPGNLSDSQKEKLNQLREGVKDVLDSNEDPAEQEVRLLKFLRARRFDLKKTEKMFRKDVEWREQNKISTILDWYEVPEVFKTYWCGGICGLDKEGRAVTISPVGNFHPKGVMYSATKSDIMKTYTYYLELTMKKHREFAKEQGVKLKEGAILIFDLESLGAHHLWKPGFEMFTATTSVAEQHYPELIHKLFVVRAPKVFPVAYSLVKPFLREDTRKKIHVLGDGWKQEILKYVNADQLPVYWGGTKKDPDGNEKCPSMIKLGGKVPKEFYLKGREPVHTLTTYQVSRGGVIEFKYEVTKPDSVLRYEFQTDCADIKFGFDRMEGKKRTALVKLEKYNSHMVPENGEIVIPEPGSYAARFDNSHSWTKSKKLSYWLELLEPADVDPDFQETLEDLDHLNLNDY